MGKTFSFWRMCVKPAARGSTPFANDWQWGIGNPTVAAIAPTLAWLTAWLGTDYMTAEHPVLGPLLVALVAFVITWFAAFLIRMLRYAPRLYYQEKDRADVEKQRADALQKIIEPPGTKDIYVSDINIATRLTPPANPVLLIGKAVRNEERLRIVVEHSHYIEGLGWSGWCVPWQVELPDLKDVIVGQHIMVPIVSASSPHDKPVSLIWGSPGGPLVNAIQKNTKYRAWIRLIGADGNEQAPICFLLICMSTDESQYLVNVTEEYDFDFCHKWKTQ